MTGPQVIVRQVKRRHGPQRESWHAYHLGFMPEAAGTTVVLGWDGPRAIILDLHGASHEWVTRALAAILDASRAQASAGDGQGAAS